MKTSLLALALLAGTQNLHAQGTAFTYQGRLEEGGTPASGNYDLTFALFNAGSGGSALAGPLTNAGTGVSNGLFTVTLDFGGGVFTGPNRWLEIAVRTNGGSGFATLTPRQPLRATPYAIQAGSASGLSGTLPVSQVSGMVPLAQLPAAVLTNNATGVTVSGDLFGNFGGSFFGNGGGLTGLNPANLSAGTAAINISGNAATATSATTAANLSGNVTDAQLSPNIARLNGTNSFTGTNTFAGKVVLTNVNNVINGSFSGNGGGLTNLDTAQLANSVLTNGETGVTLGGTFSGSGAGLTGLNASQLTSGTIPQAQLPSTVLTNGQGGIVTLNGSLSLPNTTASAGIIYSGGSPLLQTYGINNFFAGIYAGNLTMSGYNNSANGNSALRANTSGSGNTASGGSALYSNTSGSYNTASGNLALSANTNGTENTASGYGALASNTSGSYNTAQGFGALYNNTLGSNNIALGFNGGYSITTGSYNIDIGNYGFGTDAGIIRLGTPGTHTQTFIAGVITGDAGGLTNLYLGNISGLLGGDVQGTPIASVVHSVGGQTAANVASGASAANAANSDAIANTIVKRDGGGNFTNTSITLNGNLNLPATTASVGIIYFDGVPTLHSYGGLNFFGGWRAGNLTMSGGNNVGLGDTSLISNTSGSGNTAAGSATLEGNTTGSYNTALGASALFHNSLGSFNIGLGYNAGNNLTTGSSNICIGNAGFATDTNIIRIGSMQTSAYIAGVLNGNGGGLTNLNATKLTGTFTGNVIGAASSATNFSGSLAGDVTGTQSATVVSSVGGQTAATVASGAIAANAAASANTPSTLVKRDASGNFAAGNLTLGGSLVLPAAATADDIIYSGSSSLLLADNSQNFFAGIGAGNVTMSAYNNTGVGFAALQKTTTGNQNTAVGNLALYSNTNGYQNTANGYMALFSNTSGHENTANGAGTLCSNTSGNYNTANGSSVLYYNTNGCQNTAEGYYALNANTSGSYNTAVGFAALSVNASGSNNIALGFQAGFSLTTGSGNICIGNQGVGGDNNIIRIGSSQTSAYIAGAINGNGSGLTSLNASSLSSGTVGDGLLSANVPRLNGTQTFSGQNTFNSPVTLGSSLRLLDKPIYFRVGTDLAHGLGWCSSGSFAGFNPDGPVLWGNGGGGLGTVSTTTNLALVWNSSGRVGIGRSPSANALEVSGNASKDVSGSWLANSDARIKTDIATVTNALDTLSKVRLVSFRYNDEYRATHPAVADRRYLNVLAQEFREVFPEHVQGSGERLPSGEEILQVDPWPITIYSAAAVQELNRKLEEKGAEIQALKRQNESLAERLSSLEQLVKAAAAKN